MESIFKIFVFFLQGGSRAFGHKLVQEGSFCEERNLTIKYPQMQDPGEPAELPQNPQEHETKKKGDGLKTKEPKKFAICQTANVNKDTYKIGRGISRFKTEIPIEFE